jgi:hypothetical protein
MRSPQAKVRRSAIVRHPLASDQTLAGFRIGLRDAVAVRVLERRTRCVTILIQIISQETSALAGG